MPLHHRLATKLPRELLALKNLPGLGPKRLKLLIDNLHIHSREDLERAARAGRLKEIRGFGPKLEAQLREALERHVGGTDRRVLYPEAAQVASRIAAYMRKCQAAIEVEVAGSFRRRRDTIGDLDLVAASAAPASVIKWFASFPEVAKVTGSGETKSSVTLKSGLQIDLRVVPLESFGAALTYFTGSKAHNVHLRRIAQSQGLLLNEYGLFRDGSPIAGRTEAETYRALGLEWIAPELREDRGEIEASAEGRLPHLIERKSLRGDLHTHSTYTDGRASIEAMARQARENGLEYLAITDHSRRVAMAHGLDGERLREQRREIERVAKRFPGLVLLQGIELDILEDGTLDLSDTVLAELDWVVASVHYKLDQDSARMTRRLVAAMRNPHVDAIGHPSGRLIGHREPSNFDFREILHVAREEGCALEVNSQPDRMDLTDTACMAATEAGVKLIISSDAHSTRELGLVEFGINQARRGWVEDDDVLNTRSWSRLKSVRRRGG
jgi:DNA polymerase (family 10)